MDIDNLTLGQIKQIQAMLGASDVQAEKSPHIGKKCIIRTYASGVHFGEVVSQAGRQVELKNARRLWRWDVAPHGVSLSEVAVYGPVGYRSKICCVVDQMSILDALEVIPCSDSAVKVIEEAAVYTP